MVLGARDLGGGRATGVCIWSERAQTGKPRDTLGWFGLLGHAPGALRHPGEGGGGVSPAPEEALAGGGGSEPQPRQRSGEAEEGGLAGGGRQARGGVFKFGLRRPAAQSLGPVDLLPPPGRAPRS